MGIGALPGPGGTIGSFILYVPALLLLYLGISSLYFSLIFAIIMIVSFILCVYVGRYTDTVFGEPDPNSVILDEVSGASLTLLFFPFVSVYRWQGILIAFLLFRFFDIFKPLGIRSLEKIPSGYGIVLDDIGAGLAAFILLQISRFLI